jgi:protein-L-isoaspartate(D-aspartate) O-methyltransferase
MHFTMRLTTRRFTLIPLVLAWCGLLLSCAREVQIPEGLTPEAQRAKKAASVEKKEEESMWKEAREGMVAQLKLYRIADQRVLEAMTAVRRHMFIPEQHRRVETAYGDYPWTIGWGQTISQPYIVAYMTEKMAIKPGDKVLDIGTGSGYQAAVLAEMGADVCSIEIVPELARHAQAALKAEGYGTVRVLTGDGYKGWPEHAPFDVILVACAPEDVPAALAEQLGENGRLIIPVGPQHAQRLVILRKKAGEIVREDDLPVRFVPMVRGE